MLLWCPWVASSLLGGITVSLLGQTLGEVRKKGQELGFPLMQANVLVLFCFACDLCPETPFPEAVRGTVLRQHPGACPAAWASHEHFMVLTLGDKVYFAFFFFLKSYDLPNLKPLDYPEGIRNKTTQLHCPQTRARRLVPWRQPSTLLQPSFLAAPGWDQVQGVLFLLCRK